LNRDGRIMPLLVTVLCVATLSISCGSGSDIEEDASVLLQKARDLTRIKQYRSAVEVLERAVALDPGSYEIHREYIKLLSREDITKAEEIYGKLLQDHPADPLYLLCLSRVEEDDDKNAALIDEALALDPVSYWPVVEKARFLCDNGNAEAAVELLQKIVGKETGATAVSTEGAAEGAFLLARALEEVNCSSEASSVLEKLMAAHHSDKVRSRASGKLFSLKWNHDDREGAYKLAGELLDTMNDPFLLVDIAYDMSDTEKYKVSSVEYFVRAITASDTINMRNFYPEASAGWLQNRSTKNKGFFGEGLGKVYCDLGRFEEAVPVLEKARTDLHDPLSEILLYLARAYENLGRDEDAIEVLVELLSKQTDDEGWSLVKQLYTRVHGSLDGLETRIEKARESFSRAAPAFTLREKNGEEFSLHSLKGKVVLLAFWFPT